MASGINNDIDHSLCSSLTDVVYEPDPNRKGTDVFRSIDKLVDDNSVCNFGMGKPTTVNPENRVGPIERTSEEKIVFLKVLGTVDPDGTAQKIVGDNDF